MIAVNLIPEDVLARRQWSLHVTRWCMVLGLAAAFLLGCIGLSFITDRGLRLAREDLDALAHKSEGLRKEVAAEGEKVQLLENTLRNMEVIRKKRIWTGLLQLVGRETPPEVWLTEIDSLPEAPGEVARARTAATSSSNRIDGALALQLRGYAKSFGSVHEMARLLRESGAFTDVTLDTLKKELSNTDIAFRFEMTCRWADEA